MPTFVVSAIIGILAFAGNYITGHSKDRVALRDRVITDAEKQCFPTDNSPKDCTVLNNLSEKVILKTVKVKTPLGTQVEIKPDTLEAK